MRQNASLAPVVLVSSPYPDEHALTEKTIGPSTTLLDFEAQLEPKASKCCCSSEAPFAKPYGLTDHCIVLRNDLSLKLNAAVWPPAHGAATWTHPHPSAGHQ